MMVVHDDLAVLDVVILDVVVHGMVVVAVVVPVVFVAVSSVCRAVFGALHGLLLLALFLLIMHWLCRLLCGLPLFLSWLSSVSSLGAPFVASFFLHFGSSLRLLHNYKHRMFLNIIYRLCFDTIVCSDSRV